jgi:hypothetical protein
MKLKLLQAMLIVLLVCGCSSSNESDISQPEEEEMISVSVKDLSGPVIRIDRDTFELTVGDSFKLDDHITILDNVDKDLKYELKGNYDTSKEGSYEVTVHAKDKAGNASNKKITIVVKEKENHPEPDTGKGQSSTSDSGNSSQSSGSNSSQQSSRGEKPVSEQFLLTNGYTMSGGSNPADDACAKSILNNVTPGWLGQCRTIVDSNGIPIGSESVWTPY